MWLPMWVLDGNGFTTVHLDCWSKLLVRRPAQRTVLPHQGQDNRSWDREDPGWRCWTARSRWGASRLPPRSTTSHIREFPRKRRLYLRNVDRLSNYLALLVRRKEGDIRGVTSTSYTHDTFDG